MDSGEIISKFLNLFELLNHECFYIFVENLSSADKQNEVYNLLDIFDQKYIINNDNKWILEISHETKNINKSKLHIMTRLQQATLDADLLEKARVEEIYNIEFDIYQNEQNRMLEEAKKETQEANKRAEKFLEETQEANKRAEKFLEETQEANKKIEAMQKEMDELKKLLHK